jgi:Beta-ketoacyl synthase, N-terminal domain
LAAVGFELMTPRSLYIDGIAFWSPQLPSWDAARAAFVHPTLLSDAIKSRPAPTVMAANERRRASDSVLVALEVAAAAVAHSGHDASTLASVFTSAHGDLPITDALCRTLAADPLLLSPMRFHHSVHNAASGYWAIASGSHAASTALAAYDHSFGAGLLEAAGQCTLSHQPVLLVGFDTEACGPLASSNRSRGLLGVALVLAGQRSAASKWQLSWSVTGQAAPAPGLQSPAARQLAHNAMADALPLFEALAVGRGCELGLPAGGSSGLELRLESLTPTRADGTVGTVGTLA